MTNESISRFRNIMDDLRKLPDTSDEITAYGCYGGLVDMDVLGDFAEAIWTDEELETLSDDLVNAYSQLFSIDFESKHEGIETFYENFYGFHEYDTVLRACNWLDKNGFSNISKVIIDGYESKEKQTIAKEWIDNNASEIYKAYRKMMFDFEKKYL